MYDIVIVGAGPSGASAAYFLGEAGQRVLVLEKEKLPHYKTCGGGLSTRMLDKYFPFSFELVIESKARAISYAFGARSITIPLSLVQLVKLAGVVVVTTPQSVAVSDVLRSIEMFQATGASVLGVVENMSYLQCPDCGRRLEIFGRGGGEWLAGQFEIPLLGRIPLDPAICESGDLGQSVSEPDSPVAQAFRQVAGKVAAQVSIHQFAEARR